MAPPAGHSALDDTDHDGSVELLELAFGGDPNVSDPGATPAVIIEAGFLTTTIAKQPGVTYLVETAATLDAAFSATSTAVLTNTAPRSRSATTSRWALSPRASCA